MDYFCCLQSPFQVKYASVAKSSKQQSLERIGVQRPKQTKVQYSSATSQVSDSAKAYWTGWGCMQASRAMIIDRQIGSIKLTMHFWGGGLEGMVLRRPGLPSHWFSANKTIKLMLGPKDVTLRGPWDACKVCVTLHYPPQDPCLAFLFFLFF